MTTLTRPDSGTGGTAQPPSPANSGPVGLPRGRSTDGVVGLVASLALLAATMLPLREVFLGTAWVRPVAGAALVSIGLAWGLRQLGAPATVSASISFVGWAVFVSLVFASETVAFAFVPTLETLSTVMALVQDGRELFMVEAAPVIPVAPFLLFAVTGVWLVGFLATDGIVRHGSALYPVGVALVAFTFPLPLAPSVGRATVSVVAFLAAASLLLLVTGRSDAGISWQGAGTAADGRAHSLPLLAGVVVATVAIGAGVAFGDSLPGADEPPIYRLRGTGGTTVTTNPMVALRPNLTAQDQGPVVHVTSPRPVYLRTAALDHYDEFERWTVAGRIRGSTVPRGRLPQEVEGATSTGEIDVDIELANLRGVLMPVPYPPLRITGRAAGEFQYDQRHGIVTLASDAELERGDTYTVTTALPPDAASLRSMEGYAGPDSQLTALPDNVPEDVVDLAREIVTEAGATTPFDMALAIQEELRTWTYSLEPEQGHGGDAMQAFIENRVGYCEQFAGTMAVMLRTLDIPARVAVGFGPGDLVDPEEGRWTVSNANAHAWVEVLFPGHGWVAFEPTPRSDGNVLVPSAGNLAPSDTVAADVAGAEGEDPAEDPDSDDVIPETDPADPAFGPTPGDIDPGSGATGVTGADGRWGTAAVIGAALAAGVAATAAAVVLHDRRLRSGGARTRVLYARRQIERLGRGLGLHPRPSDTDAEYLARVGAHVGRADAAMILATEAGRARYALRVPEEGASRAEEAATRLLEALPGAFRRARVTVRGAAAGRLRALRGGRPRRARR